MYFYIQQLTKQTCLHPPLARDEVIEICLVLKGGATIINKGSLIFLDKNDFYWVRHDKYRRIKTEPDAEGYLIHFNKALLQNGNPDFYSSYFATFSPLPPTGEVIQTSDIPWNRALCEMMHQEFKSTSDFKMQVLSGLLSVFLLQLTRRSNVVMWIPQNIG